MRFRKVKYSDVGGFFIGNCESSILVIPFGSLHIFSCLEILDREIRRQAQRANKDIVDVYVDILPVAGNREKTIVKFVYDKSLNEIDWLSAEELSFQEAPDFITGNIKKIYQKHKKNFWKFLLPSERKKFELVLSS